MVNKRGGAKSSKVAFSRDDRSTERAFLLLGNILAEIAKSTLHERGADDLEQTSNPQEVKRQDKELDNNRADVEGKQ